MIHFPALLNALFIIAQFIPSILEIVAAASCASLTKKYYKEESFNTCTNLLAGHDIYFAPNCPVSAPRLCLEPTPPGFESLNSTTTENFASSSKPIHYYPNEKNIAFANMTAVKDRIHIRVLTLKEER